ncbi:hypothetical protein MXG66_004878 [Salmonella enterica]|nr:hypothetical protein [Salmonella enterica]EDR4378248.1 hypothetical protein [Salmonella enterica]EEG5735332.1 hypothetical protein [Salmonella enterica]EEG6159397.1 hypothetical protein [Salmonella enterica]EEH7435717.1 hypothetical protein [Salmonella enterica]
MGIYIGAPVIGQQGQSLSPDGSTVPQPGKVITPTETHSFLSSYNYDLAKMGWQATKGALPPPASPGPGLAPVSGEWEIQYQLSADDLACLLRYDGRISIKLDPGNTALMQADSAPKGLFDVYLRIPEAIATERIPARDIPPPTPARPYLVAALRTKISSAWGYKKFSTSSPGGLLTFDAQVPDLKNPEVTINIRDARLSLGDNPSQPPEFLRTDINIPEGAICIRPAPDPLNGARIRDIGISLVHEPPEYTLSPEDDGATIYAPSVCTSYRLNIPDRVFPKGFHVMFSGAWLNVSCVSADTALRGVTDLYPKNGLSDNASHGRHLIQTGEDGKTWLLY